MERDKAILSTAWRVSEMTDAAPRVNGSQPRAVSLAARVGGGADLGHDREAACLGGRVPRIEAVDRVTLTP